MRARASRRPRPCWSAPAAAPSSAAHPQPRGAREHPPRRHGPARQDRHRHRGPDEPHRRDRRRGRRRDERAAARRRRRGRQRAPVARAVVAAAPARGLELPAVERFPRPAASAWRASSRAAGSWSARRRVPRPSAALEVPRRAARARAASWWRGAARRAAPSRSPTRSSPTLARRVAALRALGLRPVLLTGDAAAPARAVAAEVGIDATRDRRACCPRARWPRSGGCRPRGTSSRWSATASTTPPALAQADLGIAMGSGTDVAVEAGDLTLVRADLRRWPTRSGSRARTLATIKVNLFWAFAYNVAAIPLAARRAAHPMIAAGGDGLQQRLRGDEQPAPAPLHSPTLTTTRRPPPPPSTSASEPAPGSAAARHRGQAHRDAIASYPGPSSRSISLISPAPGLTSADFRPVGQDVEAEVGGRVRGVHPVPAQAAGDHGTVDLGRPAARRTPAARPSQMSCSPRFTAVGHGALGRPGERAHRSISIIADVPATRAAAWSARYSAGSPARVAADSKARARSRTHRPRDASTPRPAASSSAVSPPAASPAWSDQA